MLPQDLRDRAQWLCSGDDKAPRSPKTGHYADIRNPALYGTYEEAEAYAKTHNLDVGFALTPDDPFVVIDLDHTTKPEDVERHIKIFEAFPTYTEYSRSGKGIHIWCKGQLPKGARRDGVEIYPHARYIICTGKPVPERNIPIVDCQPILDILFQEINRNGNGMVELVEQDALLSDQDVYDMATRASNADKFEKLARGEWQDEYPSQSEADYALMNILAYYSRSNEQCKRLFRYSALGKRSKAQREPYLDTMLKKIRAEEPQPIDFSGLAVSPGNGSNTAIQPPAEIGTPPPSKATGAGFLHPPGLIGRIAQYIEDSSSRPVPEVSSWAAIGLMAGVMGRQFNISSTGLNQYLILLAKTGVGKEEGPRGIERLLKAARSTAPVVDQFMGPGTFASGQAIIRTLDEKPSFVSVLGEFGLTLQDLSDENANSLNRVMRRVLLDLYTKSGKSSVLYQSAYSDKEKNTKSLFAPAMTLMGESTPETFYAGLSLHHIADGLVPRFLIIEYEGDRPDRNPNAFFDPPEDLVAQFVDRVDIVLRMQANNVWENVALDEDAQAVLSRFDRQCDNHIRAGGNEGIRQLWNRAHLKALRLAALIAVADRPHHPVVNKHEAEYAIWLVTRDVDALASRFESGDVGLGDSKQMADIKRVLQEYLDDHSVVSKYGLHQPLWEKRVVQRRYVQRRVAGLSAFRNDRRGAVRAMNDALEGMEKSGHLEVVPRVQLKGSPFKFDSNETCWFIRDL